jgi:hypothetical protein
VSWLRDFANHRARGFLSGTANHTVAMVRLPVELYENVFKHCYRFDLITLSRVSRTTQPEAERILYHHVAFLSSTNIRAVVYAIMFCKQILQSPRRAAYVKSLLSVIWVLKHNNFLLALRKLFSRAIASMPHLRTLRVVKSELLDFMILSQSPIKLWHFGSDSTEKTALLRFLVTQGELRSMSLMARIAGPNSRPTSILPRSLPPHLFPGLTVLIADAHDASRLVPGCPISHLYLYNNPVYLLANLSGGSNMIKVFRAENVSHNIMQTIPGAIPGVEVLRMSCRVAALNVRPTKFSRVDTV